MINEYKRLSSHIDIEKLCKCGIGYVDAADCSWYHRNWMVLRNLDIVSNPFWHQCFYEQHLNEYASHPDSKNLVLGTADFSMPYLCKQIGISKLYISDICPTPLNICSAIALKEGFDWQTFSCDARQGIASQYNLIVNDAFLTRFNCVEKRYVLAHIGQALISGGKFVTTIRKGWNSGEPLVPSRSEKESFVRNAMDLAQNYSRSLVEKSARQYIEKMTSYPIKDEDSLVSLCDGIFSIAYLSAISTPGECVESTYFEVVFMKK